MMHKTTETDETIDDVAAAWAKKRWTRPVLQVLHQDMDDVAGLLGANLELITGPTS